MKKDLQRLPDSELDIMLALWMGHPDMSRSEIEAIANKKKQLAPTTILSLLTRLEKKNFVSVKKQGKINLYSPLISREEYQRHESKNILERLYGNSIKTFVTALYQNQQLNHEEIKELDAYLKELDAEEG